MPQLLEAIDQIARTKRCDVLCLVFNPVEGGNAKVRSEALEWLTGNGVAYQECFDVLKEGVLVTPYAGTVYFDIPYDLADANYIRIQEHFENPDGSMKIRGVTLSLLPLELAMRKIASLTRMVH